eukprot:GFKZ01000365.1.p1 GENE.GFKZ01000365.1~~GFKZ01000365.1.p1  ORF type:complete len:265 (-),score=19.27 GFKZ01000365.1:700-1494(-)
MPVRNQRGSIRITEAKRQCEQLEDLRKQLLLQLNAKATAQPQNLTWVGQIGGELSLLPLSNRWNREEQECPPGWRSCGYLACVGRWGWIEVYVGPGQEVRDGAIDTLSECSRGGTDSGKKRDVWNGDCHHGRFEVTSVARTDNFQRSSEKARLRYQFSDNWFCDWGMNLGMTFMSYRRGSCSILAEWLNRMKNDLKNEEQINLASTFRGYGEGGKSFRVVLSKALYGSLESGKRVAQHPDGGSSILGCLGSYKNTSTERRKGAH